jgi:tryptophan synthase alpha subunit
MRAVERLMVVSQNIDKVRDSDHAHIGVGFGVPQRSGFDIYHTVTDTITIIGQKSWQLHSAAAAANNNNDNNNNDNVSC